jgi:hypothetical protein
VAGTTGLTIEPRNLLKAFADALESLVSQTTSAVTTPAVSTGNSTTGTSQTTSGQDLLKALANALESITGQQSGGGRSHHATHGNHLLRRLADALESAASQSSSTGSTSSPGQNLLQSFVQALQTALHPTPSSTTNTQAAATPTAASRPAGSM